MIEAAVRTLLLADPTVSGLVTGTDGIPRFWPLVLPQKPSFPAITYQRISNATAYTQDGPALARPRLQIDSWATDYDTAKALAGAVSAVLSGFKGMASDVAVLGIFSSSDRELYEPEVRPAPALYRVSSDYFVWIAASAA